MTKAKKIKFVNCPECGARTDGEQLGQHIGRDHAEGAWRIYAQVYPEKMWFGQRNLDKTLVSRFKNTVTCEVLKDLLTKYGVIRSFLGNDEKRLQPFADMLNGYRDTAMTRENVPGIVEKEVLNMGMVYGASLVSAITKSFWMMKQHPVVIRDTKVLDGMKRRELKPGSTYCGYHNAWFKFYDAPETQKGLDDALAWLPESPAAKRIVAEHLEAAEDGEKAAKAEAVEAEIRRLAALPLVRNRVADMRLFYEGGGYLEKPLKCED